MCFINHWFGRFTLGFLLVSIVETVAATFTASPLHTTVYPTFADKNNSRDKATYLFMSQNRRKWSSSNEIDDIFASSGSVSGKNRRDFFLQSQQQISTIVFTSLVLGNNVAHAEETSPSTEIVTKLKTIVITGANSGIGFQACKRLVAQGHTIILACRSINKAQDAAERIQNDENIVPTGKLIPAECNLADMESIKRFVETFAPSTKVDALCLNAGVARNTAASDCARTKDGFELTVGVNHFGHFYLNHLMLPYLANDGRIVVTASSVHDPESPGGAQGVPATLGSLSGLQQLGKKCEMIDGNPFNADKAYKDSKLCNVLFTRELQRRLAMNEATKNLSVNCFSPGLIVGTGLFRDQNPFFTKLFDVAATNILKVGETPEWGGASLDYMTTVTTKGLFYDSAPGSSKYGEIAFGREFIPMNVSKEGQDDSKAKLLWDLSANELGISSLAKQ